jgi:ribosomal protein S18 acetylase RimI-like enzyme
MTAGHTTDSVIIRAYCDADWPAVCAVHDRARPDELRGSCDPRAFVPLANEQEDAADFQRSRKFVACIGDQIVGFVGVDGTYLSWLYVDPAYYGRGIGRRLLRLGVSLIGPQAWTVVLTGNSRARRLYESEGFRVVRTCEGFNAGYPCTSMQLALSPSAAIASPDIERPCLSPGDPNNKQQQHE